MYALTCIYVPFILTRDLKTRINMGQPGRGAPLPLTRTAAEP